MLQMDPSSGEEKFRALFEFASDCLVILNLQGEILDINQTGHERLGYAKDEMIGKPISLFNAPEYTAISPRYIAELKNNGHATFELAHMRKDGSRMPVEVNGKIVKINGQNCIFSIVRDITERKLLENQLRLSQFAMDNAFIEILWLDSKARIHYANKQAVNNLGYSFEELTRLSIPDLDPNYPMEQWDAHWEALRNDKTQFFESKHKRKDGSAYPVEIIANYVKYGDLEFNVWFTRDITERKQNEALIWKQANYDFLTGLPNRHMINDHLEQLINQSKVTGEKIALMLVDLDQFKEVNDTLGHVWGDLLLLEAGKRLSSCLSESDTIGRLGGDEFTIIIHDFESISIVERVANEVINKLANPFHLGNDIAYISASIGISVFPDDAEDKAALFQNVDQAMYAAKRQGKNRYLHFLPSLQENTKARIALANELRVAFSELQFEVYYQPIVTLSTGKIKKAEALIRWEHPVHGTVSPADFIPIAEEIGLIEGIGDWVFHQAANFVGHLHANGKEDFQISVNVSPLQFKESSKNHFVWSDHLKKLGLPGRSIVIEITENLLMEARSEITGQLLRFRDEGMEVALDDFGTGYSSLSYLQKFDIDYIKIDRSFISQLAPDSNDMALCEAIIVMAHKLGLMVIAEGVETEVQCSLLKNMGCDYGQGYLWSKPVQASQFERLLN